MTRFVVFHCLVEDIIDISGNLAYVSVREIGHLSGLDDLVQHRF